MIQKYFECFCQNYKIIPKKCRRGIVDLIYCLIRRELPLFVLLMPGDKIGREKVVVSPEADKFQFKRMNSGMKHKLIE